MKIGVIGLGKMGRQIALRLSNAGHEVVATDINPDLTKLMADTGIPTVENREQLVRNLDELAAVWVMIPSQFVGDELEALSQLLPAGSIVIDGGNSDYRLTRERARRLAAKGLTLVDAGTSGGILGGERGFSLMVGGDPVAVNSLQSVFAALAQPEGWGHFGAAGAGHYVKMVHNAIEYGMMEAYAEGYRLLHESKDYPDIPLGQVASVWQHGSIISSTLNEVTGTALTASPELEGIDGYVAESGEARWTLEAAKAQGIEMPAIQAALDVRLASQSGKVNFATKLLAAMRNIFGGHEVNKQ